MLGAILQSELSKTLIVFILMTDGDYSQEVNKMSEHEIYIDHSFTRHLSGYLWFCKASSNFDLSSTCTVQGETFLHGL